MGACRDGPGPENAKAPAGWTGASCGQCPGGFGREPGAGPSGTFGIDETGGPELGYPPLFSNPDPVTDRGSDGLS
jgi:hypothetical protein